MNFDNESSKADHFLSLLEKKNVWEVEIFSSILDINSTALSIFIKSLPMAYGLYIQKEKLTITYELVKDVKLEIKEAFTKWYENTVPDKFKQKEIIVVDEEDREIKKALSENQQSKIKLTVYGENFLVQKLLDDFLKKTEVQPTYKYIGGYEPINFQRNIGNENYNCQFAVINYKRDILSLAPLLFEQPTGFLFVFNPLEPLQVERVNIMVKNLIEKRKTDLFISFLAILEIEEAKEFINEITEILSLIVEILEDIEIFKVSFAILRRSEEIERKINDLIQTANLIQKE